MSMDYSDTTIAEIHRIRTELLSRFNGDLAALTADARVRMEASNHRIIRRGEGPSQPAPSSANSSSSGPTSSAGDPDG